ncbi:type II toxin-antitoxin system HicB family antitoxin [Lacticaseibacillus pantheris]|uniref:type II toxin-antitoxin system HicB family antitoxin n=1 Tax=Lacticaseibacillus pantheris TaxID=171523 RepID=UPI002659B3EC|nr:type II toxin-antitoxin system HicB family antitoxin [Lacticaseibacillus pantheris]WKF85261.1 type II toxin-antitoxin system HicB family antitoxin [Lacticaseibacillus pantheris]
MRYIYFADFVKNEQGQFEVTFPDLAPNVATYGNNLAEALHMANDALSGYLVVMEDDGDRLPPRGMLKHCCPRLRVYSCQLKWIRELPVNVMQIGA